MTSVAFPKEFLFPSGHGILPPFLRYKYSLSIRSNDWLWLLMSYFSQMMGGAFKRAVKIGPCLDVPHRSWLFSRQRSLGLGVEYRTAVANRVVD